MLRHFAIWLQRHLGTFNEFVEEPTVRLIGVEVSVLYYVMNAKQDLH